MGFDSILKWDPNQPRDEKGRWSSQGFSDWFGKSQIVEADGTPKTVYHGTTSDFDAFDRVGGGNMWGPGYYLTTNPDTASGYAMGTAGGRIAPEGNAGANVMPVHLSVQNAFRMSEPLDKKTLTAVEQVLGESLKDYTWPGMKNRDLRQVLFQQFTDQAGANRILERAGFDALIESSATAGPGETIMVFKPQQIKSAIGNQGTYDKKDPRITKFEEIFKFDPNQPRDENGRWTSEGASWSPEVKAAGVEVLAAYDSNGLENLVVLGPKGEKMMFVEGKRDSVPLTKSELASIKPGSHLVHNHPGPRSLSSGDLYVAASLASTITCVDRDGGMYTATPKVIGNDGNDFLKKMAKVDDYLGDELVAPYSSLKRYKTEIPDEDASILYPHVLNLRLHKLGLIDYKFKLGSGVTAIIKKYPEAFRKMSDPYADQLELDMKIRGFVAKAETGMRIIIDPPVDPLSSRQEVEAWIKTLETYPECEDKTRELEKAKKLLAGMVWVKKWDPNQPRDANGRWTDAIQGLPEGVSLEGPEFSSLREGVSRGAFNIRVNRALQQWGTQAGVELEITPNDIPEHWKATRRGQRYDPEYWAESDSGYLERTDKNPRNDPDGREEGYIFRGMSFEEYQAAQEKGYIESRGDYNLGTEQEGLTYYSKDMGQASHYASGFAPWQYKATTTRPAVMVKVRDPGNHVRVAGTGEDEVGIRGRVPLSEVEGVFFGRPTAISPGVMDILYDKHSKPKSGSSSGMGAHLRWDYEPRAKKWDDILKFDPDQPRDKNGRWVRIGVRGPQGELFSDGVSDDPRVQKALGRVRKDRLTERENYIKQAASKTGAVEDYIATRDHVRKLMANAEVSIAHRTWGTIEKIIDDGRVKTQFETGISNGAMNPHYRSEMEAELFHMEDDISFEPEQRPVYGTFHGDPTYSGSLQQYGGIKLILKKEAINRTTFTGADSLRKDWNVEQASYQPSLVRDPHLASFFEASDLDGSEAIMDQLFRIRSTDSVVDLSNRDYMEVQVHGQVKVSDIDRIEYESWSGEPPSHLHQRLEKLGIKVVAREIR